MHAIWMLLLDAEFMHAYVHGIVMECIDGILQRFFPWFSYLLGRLSREVSIGFCFLRLISTLVTVSSLHVSNTLAIYPVPDA